MNTKTISNSTCVVLDCLY